MSDAMHGWVRPRTDGAKARCGGPAICPICQKEQADYLTSQSIVAHGEGLTITNSAPLMRFTPHVSITAWELAQVLEAMQLTLSKNLVTFGIERHFTQVKK